MKNVIVWLKDSYQDYGNLINEGLDCGLAVPPYQSF